MTPAVNIGIFYDVQPTASASSIKYIMNPDFEEEIDNHTLGPNEAVIKMPKATYGISFTPNAMTLADVQAILVANPTPTLT